MKEEELKDLENLYRSWPTEQLLRAEVLEKDDYRPEALTLISRELERRKISPSEKEALLRDLVSELPGEPEYVELVTVLTSGDPAILAVARSMLEDAGIECLVKGEGLEDLFAAGRLGFGFNPAVGPIEIQVVKDDEQEAMEALREFLEDMEERDSSLHRTQSSSIEGEKDNN